MDNKIKILIVEDEVLSAMYLKMQLKKYNYDTFKTAISGEEAVEIAGNDKPEIILMDIRLADTMDGIQAAEEILKIYSPKIIFVTGYDDVGIKNKANKVHNYGYFTKPVDILQLKNSIDSIVLSGNAFRE